MNIQKGELSVEEQPEFTGCYVEGLATPYPIESTGCTDEAAVRDRGDGIDLVRQEAYDEIVSICQEMRRAIRPIKEGAASLLRGDAESDVKTRKDFLRLVVTEIDRVSVMVAGLPDSTIAGMQEQSSSRAESGIEHCWDPAATEQGRRLGVIVGGDLKIDLLNCQVTVGKREIRLTPTEFRLLCYLASSSGRVISNTELLSQLWGPKYGNRKQYLRVFVSQLRRKIEPNPKQPKYILTVSYWGYCFRRQGIESDSDERVGLQKCFLPHRSA